MSLITISSPHIFNTNSTAVIMRWVCLACLPALLVHCYFFGWGTLINLLIAITSALVIEAIILKIRQRSIIHYLTDFSAITTAILLGLSLPPYVPWWLIVLAAFIAMIFGKHIYGGLGQNPFNPAMVAYAILLIARPIEMSSWVAAMYEQSNLSLWQTLVWKFNGVSSELVDAYTMATPLELVKHPDLAIFSNISQAAIDYNRMAWQVLALAYAGGGFFLLYKKIISWHIPASIILGVGGLAALFYAIDPETYASPSIHILTGATIFGAFFIATDPVTAPITAKGKLIFGLLIAALIFSIRSWGTSYPDIIAFAVLLANFTVPTIDQFTQPKTYGHKK